MRRGVAVLGVAVLVGALAPLAGSLSNVGLGVAAANTGVVLGFGDSVAAGEGNPVPSGLKASLNGCSPTAPTPYCGYDAGNWTDSIDAYPAVLAAALGARVQNFARSGACARSGLPNCVAGSAPTVDAEIQQAASMHVHPQVITLTVGADDMNFKACFGAILGIPAGTCANDPASQSTIQNNITADLNEINRDFPGTPVYVTDYYDPLPHTLGSTNPRSPCSNAPLLYALSLIQSTGVSGGFAAAVQAWLTGSYSSQAAAYLAEVRSNATAIEGELNATIARAVSAAQTNGVGVQEVNLDFTGHDFCRDYPGSGGAWIFGPKASLYAQYSIWTKSVTYLPTDNCAQFDAGCRIQLALTGTKYGVNYSVLVGANDFPHPNIAGQRDIASSIRTEVTGSPSSSMPLSWGTPQSVDPLIGNPSSISCPTTNFCMMLDWYGHVLSYNGSTWSSPTALDPAGFAGYASSVSCTSPTFCVAAGGNDIYQFDGAQWTWQSPPLFSPTAIACVSSTTTCFVGNTSGQIYADSNGTVSGPTNIDPSGHEIFSLSCPTVSFCVATDNYGYAMTYNGTTWSSPVQLGSSVWVVSCASSTFCMAGGFPTSGSGQVVDSFDGSTWSQSDVYSGLEITNISCLSATFCLLVDNGAEWATFDGTIWHAHNTIDFTRALYPLDCVTTTFCITADTFGEAFIYDGSAWGPPAVVDRSAGDPSSISCPSVGFCAAVDQSGNAFTLSASGWSKPLPVIFGSWVSVSCASATFCLAVGDSDAYPAAAEFDGQSWSVISAPTPDGSGPTSVSCVTTSFCMMVDANGFASTFDGSGWTQTFVGSGGFNSVSCVTTRYCVAVGNWLESQGTYAIYSGTWSSPATVEPYSLSHVSCPTENFCAATDWNGGQVVTFNGYGWSNPSPLGAGSISCTGPFFCAAAGFSDVYLYDGRVWSPSPAKQISQISCPTSSQCYGIDYYGNVVTATT